MGKLTSDILNNSFDCSYMIYPTRNDKGFFDHIQKNMFTRFIGFKRIDDTLYISFNGSLKTFDWILNFLFFPFPVLSFLAHFGWSFSSKDYPKEILKWIDLYKPKKVVFTGHSLGGAIANLVSEVIARKRPLVDSFSVTFGSPNCILKIPFSNFRALATSVNFTDQDDAVYRVSRFLPTYESGNRVFIDDGEVDGFFDFITDHQLAKYK